MTLKKGQVQKRHRADQEKPDRAEDRIKILSPVGLEKMYKKECI